MGAWRRLVAVAEAAGSSGFVALDLATELVAPVGRRAQAIPLGAPDDAGTG
jgi:hypothetical protein